MPKKTATKKQPILPEESENKRTSFFDYLRFGESYTSLILGVIVVIVATALLLAFVHNRNAGNVNTPITQQTQNTVQISQRTEDLSKKAPSTEVENNTGTSIPTKEPTSFPTATPTIAPTIASTAVPTVVPTKIPVPTQKPKIAKVFHKKTQVKIEKDNNVWIVQKNESLWLIAEKKYNDGYKWVDIARVNNLSNPGDIHAGDKLKLPQIQSKTNTIASNSFKNIKESGVKKSYTNEPAVRMKMNKITSNSYTVVRGDNLWNIAVRAYGDGYKWVDIARENNLANPRVIHSGNVFSIPR